MSAPQVRRTVTGTAMVLAGNDIDTDRIIPARFVRELTFERLGQHVFADDRAELRQAGRSHPFDDPRFADATVLVVNKNFGCGSSREHAVHAIARAGIRAIVGESFSTIFLGNCTANGIPAVTGSEADIGTLMAAVQAEPSRAVTVDLERMEVAVDAGGPRFAVHLDAGIREQLLEGRWDTLAELLEARDDILALSARLGHFDLAGLTSPRPRRPNDDRHRCI